jgi:hypothetical protein
MGILTGIIFVVVGAVSCFFGWRIYRIVLALSGFVLGYYAASGVLVGQSDLVQIGGAIVVGLIVAFIFWTFYKFAYVLFGAFLGLVVATLIESSFNLDGTIYLILAIVLAIVGALVGSRMADLIIRLSTAFSGSTQMIAGVAAIAAATNISLPLADPTHGGSNTESTAGIVTLVLVIVIGVVGFLFQSRHDPDAN